MTDEADTDMDERNPTGGRRLPDTAHLLKWIPFLTLFGFMILQTIFVTRYVSGIELSNAALVATVAELKVEFKTLSASVSQGAVPSAQTQWRMEVMERQLSEVRSEMRATDTDNARRITALEANGRARSR